MYPHNGFLASRQERNIWHTRLDHKTAWHTMLQQTAHEIFLHTGETSLLDGAHGGILLRKPSLLFRKYLFFFEIWENSTNESNDRSIRMAPATMYSQPRTIFSYFVHEIQGLHFQLNSLKGQRKKCCSNQNIKSNDIFMTDNWFWNAKQLHTYMRSLWKKKKQISSIFFHSHSQFIGLLCGRTRHTDPTFLIVSHIIGSFRNWMNI